MTTYTTKMRFLFLWLYIGIIFTRPSMAEQTFLNYFPQLDNKTCTSVLFTVSVRSIIQCASLCSLNSQCESLFFDTVTTQCNGCPYFYPIYEESGMLQAALNTQHYGIGDVKIYTSNPSTSSGLPVYNQHDLFSDGVKIASRTYIKVYVQIAKDAHVLLQNKRTNYDTDVVEIVIGGWGNTQSVLRTEQQGRAVDSSNMEGLLSVNEFRPFWIEFQSGCVKVGQGSTVGSKQFLSWCDLTFAVNYYSVGSAKVPGTWKLRSIY